MKRIAIDCRKFDDFGIGTTIRGILGALATSGQDDLEILALGPPSIRDRLPDSDKIQFIEESAPHYSLREIHHVGRTAERAGADLLHMPHYVTPSTALSLVTTIHDLIHLRVPRHDLPLGGRMYARWMIGRAIRRSARVVTVSNAVKQEIETMFPGAAETIVVIPNGVDEPAEPPVPADQRESFLLFVGNDKPHKNVDRLVEAFADVRKAAPEVSLVLVGSRFDRFEGIDGVALRGFVEHDELVALFRRATALVQPSLMEGFGLPVAEAMSHGTPVIVSQIPSLMEVAGEAAIPIDDPTDVALITRTLTDALHDASLRRRSSTLGPSISFRFRWSTAAASLVQTWKEVM